MFITKKRYAALIIDIEGKRLDREGKTGKVITTHPSLNKVTVEGINIVKKHVKPNKAYPQGAIVELTKPMWVSKLGIYDASAKKASKIAYKVDKDGAKKRVYKTSGKEIA